MTLPTVQPDAPAASATVPGFKTSEFWLTLITLLVYGVTSFLPADMVQKWGAAHGWLGGLVVIVYVAARSYVKATRLKVGA